MHAQIGVVVLAVCDPCQRINEGQGVVIIGETEAAADRHAIFGNCPVRRLRAKCGNLFGTQPVLFTTTWLAMTLAQGALW